MATTTSSVRFGVLISHSPEDRELARELRGRLEGRLGQQQHVPHPSHVVHEPDSVAELRQLIHSRLERATALLLLASAGARGRDWVQSEESAYSDAASERGERESTFVSTPPHENLEYDPNPIGHASR